jgi:hypothetical protein
MPSDLACSLALDFLFGPDSPYRTDPHLRDHPLPTVEQFGSWLDQKILLEHHALIATLSSQKAELLKAVEGLLNCCAWRADETAAREGENALQSDIRFARAVIRSIKESKQLPEQR